MTEVGGMDMLDISQMIVTKLGFPIEPWATKYGTPAWILLGCHHTCGLLTGFPVCLYFSEISNNQWIGLILLGGPVRSVYFKRWTACWTTTLSWARGFTLAVLLPNSP